MYTENKKEEDNFHRVTKSFLICEKLIKDRKIKKMRKNFKLFISEIFSNRNNKELLLEIFEQDDIDFFLEKTNPQYLYEELLIYYKEFLFESKKKDILLLQENLIKKIELNDQYLEDYKIAKKMNIKIPIINYLFNFKNKGKKKTEKDFLTIVNLWEEIETMIKKKDIQKISEEYKEILNIYFNDKKNKEFLLEILSLDEYNYFINETNKEMIQKYIINNNLILSSIIPNIKDK